MTSTQPLLAEEELKLQKVDNHHSINNNLNNNNHGLSIKYNDNQQFLENAEIEVVEGGNPLLLKNKTHIDIINGILIRDYGCILFIICLSISFGFILYILTSITDFIYLFAIIGLIIAFIIDGIRKKPPKQRNKYIFKPLQRKETAQELDKLWSNDIDTNNNDEYKLFFKTDFYDFIHTKLKYEQCGSNKIYIKSSNPNTMIIEKRHFLDWRFYLGFETGAGIGITICLSLYFLLFFANVGKSFFTKFINDPTFHNYMEPYIENIKYLFNLDFFIICVGLTLLLCILGAIIESFLRKFNYLNHHETVQTISYLIPLHTIRGITFKTVGSDAQNFSSFTNIFIYIFKSYCWFLFAVFYGIPKLIYFIFTRNITFFLWILVTLNLAILFYIKIERDSDYLPYCVTLSVLNTFLCLFGVWYLSDCCNNNKNHCCCKSMEYERMNKKNKCCLLMVILFIFFCLVSAMILLIDVTMNINGNHNSMWKQSWNTYNSLICSNDTNPWINTTNSTNNSSIQAISGNDEYNFDYTLIENDSNDKDICSDDIKDEHLIALILLCLIWYILLFSSIDWYNNDKFKFKWKYGKAEFDWNKHKYSYIYLYIKHKGFLSKSLSNIYDFEYHRIELTTKQSYELVNYLNENVKYFTTKDGYFLHNNAKIVSFYDDDDANHRR